MWQHRNMCCSNSHNRQQSIDVTDGQTDILYYNCPDLNHATVVQSSQTAVTTKEMHKPNQQLRMRLKQDSKWRTLRRSTQGLLCCQNITRCHGTRVKLMLLTATTELLRPSGNICRGERLLRALLAPHCNAQDTDRIWTTSCDKAWLSI